MKNIRISFLPMAILALLIITPLMLTPGDAGARTNGAPSAQEDTPTLDYSKVVVRPLTADEWRILKPRAQLGEASQDTTATEFPEARVGSIDAGMYIGWGDVGFTGVQRYNVYRRLATSAGESPRPWHLIKSLESSTTQHQDTDAAPGFTYDYKVEIITLRAHPDPILINNATMTPRDFVYGYGTGTAGISLWVAPMGNAHKTGIKRITRYVGPQDHDGTMLPLGTGSIGPKGMSGFDETGLVAGKVYGYEVEYVDWDNDAGDYKVLKANPMVFIKAGAATVGSPANLTTTRAAAVATAAGLSWTAPVNAPRTGFALYEVLRRNTKQYRSPYVPIGTTIDATYHDHSVEVTQYYSYKVRTIGWDKQPGEASHRVAAPELRKPECTDASGSVGEIANYEVMAVDTTPTHRGFAFKLWMFYRNDQGEAIRCDSFEASDWYVQREVMYHHGTSADCPDPNESCVLVTRSNTRAADQIPLAEGHFGYDIATLRSPVWYDDPNPVPGLYKYSYRICSFYEGPGRIGCKGYDNRDWKFEVVDSIPFPPLNTPVAPGQ